MPKKPKISIVIRAYNEEKHLPELLHRLKRQTISEFEIILVDSGSQDKTVPIAREGGAKIVKILKQNFSFGRALNSVQQLPETFFCLSVLTSTRA